MLLYIWIETYSYIKKNNQRSEKITWMFDKGRVVSKFAFQVITHVPSLF